jgi:hypothetical protein
MDRRKALKNVALLLGTAISSSTMGVLFESFGVYDGEKNQVFFSATDEEILGEYADIIIPTTSSSAGAKAAGVGAFIPMMVRDCYPANLQHLFASGMKDMLAKCQKDFNKDFISMNTEERNKLMTDLTAEAIANGKKPSFFMIARDLTLLGYYSSEIGCTQAREYLPVPGSYDGNADYKPGQKAWAT